MTGKNKKTIVAAIQMNTCKGDKEHNLDRAEAFIEEAHKKGAKIACLPELFLTGHDLNREGFSALAETPDGTLAKRMANISKKLGLFLVTPFPERDKQGKHLWNSAMIIDRGKILGVHRKIYLWGGEKAIFESGHSCKPFPSPWGPVGVLICADAEYPEPPRLLALQGAEIILVPSVWSIEAAWRWDIFLPAWALANLCYVAGVNTIGSGVRGGNCGKSKIIDPYGRILNEAPEAEEALLLETIDLSLVEEARNILPYMDDVDRDVYNVGHVSPKRTGARIP